MKVFQLSILHCRSCQGQEQSFWWLGSLGSTPLLRMAYYNFLCLCDSHVHCFVLPFVSILKSWSCNFAEEIVRRACGLFKWLCFCCLCTVLHWLQGCFLLLDLCLSTVLLCSTLHLKVYCCWERWNFFPSLPSCSFWLDLWIRIWLFSIGWGVALD